MLRGGKILLDTWVESGWFEYLRNWDYVDCYCMFMCGVEKGGHTRVTSGRMGKWWRGKLMVKEKAKAEEKEWGQLEARVSRKRFHFGKPAPLVNQVRFSC